MLFLPLVSPLLFIPALTGRGYNPTRKSGDSDSNHPVIVLAASRFIFSLGASLHQFSLRRLDSGRTPLIPARMRGSCLWCRPRAMSSEKTAVVNLDRRIRGA